MEESKINWTNGISRYITGIDMCYGPSIQNGFYHSHDSNYFFNSYLLSSYHLGIGSFDVELGGLNIHLILSLIHRLHLKTTVLVRLRRNFFLGLFGTPRRATKRCKHLRNAPADSELLLSLNM
uniref:Uncharacterized protein n=1 Tax=Heterorhabditis bacteriophora TaxID=37862 RepID=A0A1I7WF64_HETBA